jgi:hypothetical protein
MKRIVTPLVLLLGAATACADHVPTSLSPDAPALAKNTKGGGSVDTDSRALWVFHSALSDGSAARLYGDGLDRNGAPLTSGDSEYAGETCGVRGKIFWWDPDYSQSGDAVFDPNWEASSCPRELRLDTNADGAADVRFGPFTNARQVMQVGDQDGSNSRTQVMVFTDTGIRDCDRIRFGDPDPNDRTGLTPLSGGVVVTRLAGAASPDPNGPKPATPGQWSVETVDGVGKCLKYSKGKYVETGVSHVLPFRATITEEYKS